ncbi:RNA polymerase sigma factor [Dyella flagellata]|uniref:DNA-directed RNA polymerase sigma-70 factor n=1 Tax=Dyella flagellata TaxID=1867833 RepID=A0ABQ5X9K8_9GAMM|nr:sigma-70 family RNA polymerase sigma factor [Dyella flagellata]GLQ87957.1 DNA-directed RNA polymerase sigma-70 factor [Dyella flagellata]
MRGRELQQAFEKLLQEHQRIVFKVASVYASHPEDRNDLRQEICVQLWRSFASFDARRASFSTWMYRVALNVAISYKRRLRPEESLEPEQLDTLEGAAGIAEPDERLAALHRFIAQLDPLNRALILLYLEDRDYGEMAQILGISETNVATKISRIKQKLRSRMTGDLPAGVAYGTR